MKLLLLVMALAMSHVVLSQLGPGSYFPVSPSEYENDVKIQRALYHGADKVIHKGIRQGRLPDSNFKVTQVVSVEKQVVNGLNYKFVVQLSDGKITVSTQYVVYNPAGTRKLKVTSSSFDIISASNILPLFPFPIDPPEEDDGIEEVGPDQEGDDDESSDEWQETNINILNTESKYRDLLNYGVQHVTREAIQYEILPPANYYIEDVLKIEERPNELDDEIYNYRFTIVLGDDQGKEIKAIIRVFENLVTLEKDYGGYSFEEASDQEEPTVGNWNPIDEAERDGYIGLNESLDYGIQQVIAKGIELGQLTTPNYHLGEINSIKSQVIAGTNYRFNVELLNDQGGYVEVYFVVFYGFGGEQNLEKYLFLDINETGSQPNEDDSRAQEDDEDSGWEPNDDDDDDFEE